MHGGLHGEARRGAVGLQAATSLDSTESPHLARRIRRAGIDTSHFLGQAHNKGVPRRTLDPAVVLVVGAAGSGRRKTTVLRRAMLAVGIPAHCAECENDGQWRGRPLTLLIDHINGDYCDNRRENLRFLCPNCHAQTSTWCRKTSARLKP